MFFQTVPIATIFGMNEDLRKSFQGKFEQAQNLRNIDFSAILFAIFPKLPSNHGLFRQLQQQKNSITIGSKTIDQIQKFKNYLLNQTLQIDQAAYQGGGILLQQLLVDQYKQKYSSKLTKDHVKCLSTISNISIEINLSIQSYKCQANKPIATIILFQVKENWYLPISKIVNSKQINTQVCTMCNSLQNLIRSSCGHDYCKKCRNQFQHLPLQSCKNKMCGKLLQFDQGQDIQEIFQCRICSEKFQDNKNIFCNICGHFYCCQCIRKLATNLNKEEMACPRCTNTYSLSEAINFFNDLDKQIKNMKQSENMCSVCSISYESGKNLIMNQLCGHIICLSCIEQNGIEASNCYVKSCKSEINKDAIQMFYQSMCEAALSLSQMDVKERKCQHCSKINKTPTKLEYFKCENCKVLICGKHDQLLSDCLCLCVKCLNNLKPIDDNYFDCELCKTKVCWFCKDKMDSSKAHHLCPKRKEKLSEKESSQVVRGRQQVSEKQDLKESMPHTEISNKECGGCLVLFDDYIIGLKVEDCSIHRQCLFCKFNCEKCIFCNKRVVNQKKSKQDRELVIDQVYDENEISRFFDVKLLNLDEPIMLPTRNSSVQPVSDRKAPEQQQSISNFNVSLPKNYNQLYKSVESPRNVGRMVNQGASQMSRFFLESQSQSKNMSIPSLQNIGLSPQKVAK